MKQHFRYPIKRNPLKEFVEKRASLSCKRKTQKILHHLPAACKNPVVQMVIGQPMEFNINYS